MEKFKVTFEANDQQLKSLGTKHASDTYADIEATFVLGSRWTDMDSVSAVWWNDFTRIATVLDSDGKCIVPHEVLTRKGYVRVNLVGSVVENGELVTRLTSYSAEAVKVNEKIKLTGSETSEITPSQYEQFVANVKADADRAEAGATASANSADEAEASAQNASESASASAVSASDSARSATASAGYAQNASESAHSAENAKDDAEDARDTILGMRAEATTLPEGSSATVSYNDGVMSFGIPKGDTGATGATGETGATPQLSIGTVETTTEPSVTITGTAENPVLNFGLVKGDKGDTGEVSLAEMLEQTTIQTNTDIEPYLFRATPECGRYELDEIVGGTVAWNQYIKSDFSSGVDGWQGESGSYLSFSASNGILTATYNGGATASYQLGVRPSPAVVPFVKDHKVLITVDINVSRNAGGYALRNSVAFGNSNNVTILTNNDAVDTWHRKSKIVNVLGNRNYYAYFLPSGPADNYSQGDTFKFKNHMIIDLTQMFGSTIADYIYSLEQATTGAGVAWFKKLFPKDYYQYDAGSLQSSKPSARVTTGFNQWDEEWEQGRIDIATGENAYSATRIRSKNFIPIIPSTNYYWKTGNQGLAIVYYDAEKFFISGAWEIENVVHTTPTNAHYMKFCTGDGNGGSYNAPICINLSNPSRNGEYEPYEKHSYPLDSTLTLRGIPKLDASNNLYYDGDTYESDGTVTRKYGVVDLGSLTWTYDSTNHNFKASVSDSRTYNAYYQVINMICQKYEVGTVNSQPQADKQLIINKGNTNIKIWDSAYTDAATFKTAMSGVYLVYELATPTTESADPYQNPQRCEKGGTEEYVSTSIVPVGHNTDYPMTLEDTIPATDGTYSLTVTVSGGKNTVSWS